MYFKSFNLRKCTFKKCVKKHSHETDLSDFLLHSFYINSKYRYFQVLKYKKNILSRFEVHYKCTFNTNKCTSFRNGCTDLLLLLSPISSGYRKHICMLLGGLNRAFMTPNQSVLLCHTGMQEYVYQNTKSKYWDEYITIVRKVEL